jgi:hypothetical protein
MGALHPASGDLLRAVRRSGTHMESLVTNIESVGNSLMKRLVDGGYLSSWWRGQRKTEVLVHRKLTTVFVRFKVMRTPDLAEAGRETQIEFDVFASEAVLAFLRQHIHTAKGVRR